MQAGRVKMKNCTKTFFLSEVIHPCGSAILVPHKKCLFQFPVSAVYEFFQCTFLIFKKQFTQSEFAGFKNRLMSIYLKKKKLA